MQVGDVVMVGSGVERPEEGISHWVFFMILGLIVTAMAAALISLFVFDQGKPLAPGPNSNHPSQSSIL